MPRPVRTARHNHGHADTVVVEMRADSGLVGSGMFIVNPPWQLDEELGEALPWLAERLAVDGGATYRARG